MLIPNPDFMVQNALIYLENINYKLKGTVYEKSSQLKNTKIPLIRIQIGDEKDPRKTRKLDISIFSPVNNGRQHTEYVNRYLLSYPKIKPLFFVIKKLTHCYKMYDPVKQGVRSLALFLMLAIFMQELSHDESLG
jgi:DNA polymerase sigma